MQAEFTVVLEPHPGGILASVAELADVRAVGRTAKEARAKLAERLHTILETQRRKAIARAGPEALLESLRVQMSNGPASKAGRAREPKSKRKRRGEQDVLQVLLQEGLIGEIPALGRLDTDHLRPIAVKGRPISEEIIEDRR